MRPFLYRGVCARVAKKLGVSLSIVARVAKGVSTSKRISLALEKEERRIERELAKSSECAA